MSSRSGVSLLAGLALLGCTAFPVIEAGECGNQVVEPPEDCDSFVTKSLPGGHCLPKGSPAECHFDCSRGANGKRYPCPPRMGCSPVGVCLELAGGFDYPQKLADDVGGSLAAVQFDGDADGHRELLTTELPDLHGEAGFSLLYFDDQHAIVDKRVFPRITSRPVAHDLTADGRDDLLFSNGHIGMLPGRADRTWVPAAFSSYVLESDGLRVVPLSPAFVSDSFALVAIMSAGGATRLFLPSGNLLMPSLDLGRRPFSRLLEPIAANIAEGNDSPCDELVLAFRGDTSLRIIDFCELSEEATFSRLVWRASPRQTVLRLPEGATLDRPPVAADVDGDGHLDLLVSDGERGYLARGDGSGLEAEAKPFHVQVRISEAEPHRDVELGSLLAAGDITGDGVADFVLPSHVIGTQRSLSDGSIGYFESSSNSGQPWSMAEIVDLNGNQLPDVVAAAEGSPGLTFLSGTSSLFQVPSLIGTSGPVRLLASGDFDGDLINDVALTEGSSEAKDKETLAIGFGVRDRAPLAPVRVAERDRVQQLGSQHDGALDDLFMASTQRSAGVVQSTFTLFEGDASRLPLALYRLNGFSRERSLDDSVAVALIVGGFSSPGAGDVLVLGTDPRGSAWTQWLIPSLARSKVPPRLLEETSPHPLELTPTQDGSARRISVAGAAADLDRDGYDEAIWLMPEGVSDCALLIYDLDGDAGSVTLSTKLELGEPCPNPELTAANLNHDEKGVDLLLLLGEPGARHLEMLWNDGAGHFLEPAPTSLDAQGKDIRASCPVPPNALPDLGTGIAVLAEDRLYLARTYEDQYQYRLPEPIAQFEDPRAVLATDLNGDGITELVVADARGLWLLKAKLQDVVPR